jgi:hypothetical protein
MNTITNTGRVPTAKTPFWFWAAGAFGLVWNVYGVYQFTGSFSQTPESLMAAGMTAEAAEVYFGLPVWMTLVFAIGVFGGLAGSVLLLLRRAIALPVFAVSLAGYVALFAGDVGYGVFKNNTTQLTILVFVVAVAAALFAVARVSRSRGILA